MAKQMWYTLYFAIGIGIILGLTIKTGVFPINLSIFSTAIVNIGSILHLSASNAFYFTISISILVIAAILIAISHAGITLLGSGEYGIYPLALGFFGGLILIIGFFGIISAIGIILIIIGIIIAHRIEGASPGTPEYHHSK